jgi:hypothetical protein
MMQDVAGFDFFPLTFVADGTLEASQDVDAFIDRARSTPATDAIFIAHGFRNDASEATALYASFLTSFRGQMARKEFHALAVRRYVVAAVYWPSKPFRETFDDTDGTRGLRDPREAARDAQVRLADLKHDASPAHRAKLEKAERLLPDLEGHPKRQDEFVALVMSLVEHAALDKTEGLPQLRKQSGSEVLARLGTPAGEGSRDIRGVLGTVAGGVGHFLNLMTWYVMKDRAGAVGASGVAPAVRALHHSVPTTRIHLVGHSLGGRLMATCAKALGEPPMVQPDSFMLLEAAFSHYGFSANNGHGTPGFFRDVVAKQVVKGPFVSTFSAQDTVVGKAYSVMSRLSGDSTREIGDASDMFGGIGRNGPLKTTEVATSPLHAAGTRYTFQPHVINNLDGSGGLIRNHGDVTSEAVTYAFASAVAGT